MYNKVLYFIIYLHRQSKSYISYLNLKADIVNITIKAAL